MGVKTERVWRMGGRGDRGRVYQGSLETERAWRPGGREDGESAKTGRVWRQSGR